MATSAPLSAAKRLMDYSVGLRNQSASRRGSPIYSASPLDPCRGPCSDGPSDCIRRCLHRWFCLRRIRTGSATTVPTNPECVGRVTKLQPSLDATAWRSCSPCSGQDFYYRAFMGRVAPEPMSVMTGWFIVIYHRRTFTGWTGSIMGCERISRILTEAIRTTLHKSFRSVRKCAGARVCDPQQPSLASSFQTEPTRPVPPECCGSQSRAPLVAASPRCVDR